MGIKNKILISCKTASELVVKKSDMKLSIADKLGLWIHLAYCTVCALFVEQSKVIDESTKAYAQKIQTGQKSYKLNDLKKEEINKGIHEELKNSRG